MKIKNTLKQLVEQVTSLSNKKRVSIKYKIFIGAVLFIILNIIINLLIVRISINDIYLALEKKELKSVYSNILKTKNDDRITDVIYDANSNGIKVKIMDSNLNILYTIFSDRMNNRFTDLDLVLLNSLRNSKSKIIVLNNYKKNGYDLHLVGKTKDGYAIISTSIESIKKDAKTTTIVIFLTSLITLLILLVLSYFISKLFSKKINEIKEVTDDITALKFNKKINVTTNDELGDLFNNVNIMSKRLEDNIKELEKANIKLKEDLIEKEKQENARKKLIANISHEFKTPLTIISGYSQLMLSEAKDEEDKKNLNVMISEAERLSDLVHEFLELSKLESGNIKLNKEMVDINTIIKNEIDKLDVDIKNKGANVTLKLCKEAELFVDKREFTKVIENLLTNAIKFTKGDKRIVVKTYVKDEYFYYEVYNSGDTIKESDMENIFNSYYKDKSTRNKKGTGLGLTIVKVVVDLHNGECFVKNTSDGVKFTIKIKK